MFGEMLDKLFDCKPPDHWVILSLWQLTYGFGGPHSSVWLLLVGR
jgi:hypothetical protein